MSKCNADELPAVNPPSFQATRGLGVSVFRGGGGRIRGSNPLQRDSGFESLAKVPFFLGEGGGGRFRGSFFSSFFQMTWGLIWGLLRVSCFLFLFSFSGSAWGPKSPWPRQNLPRNDPAGFCGRGARAQPDGFLVGHIQLGVGLGREKGGATRTWIGICLANMAMVQKQ